MDAGILGSGLPLPLSFPGIGRARHFQCSNCQHIFKVSGLRLLFSLRFSGIDPPTETVAFYVKCPKCEEKRWLIPFEENNSPNVQVEHPR